MTTTARSRGETTDFECRRTAAASIVAMQLLRPSQRARGVGFELRRRILVLGASLSAVSLALALIINDDLGDRARLIYAGGVGVVGLIGSSIVTARDRSGSR